MSQGNAALLAAFKRLVDRTEDEGVKDVLLLNLDKLVVKEVTCEKALQGLTLEKLMSYKLSEAAATALKEAFPSRTPTVAAGAQAGLAGAQAGPSATAGARAAAAQAGEEPPAKKICIRGSPSALSSSFVDSKGYILDPLNDRTDVAYYACRKMAPPFNLVPPALLLFPEAGAVHAAVQGDGMFAVAAAPEGYEAAHVLCEEQAKVFGKQRERQRAFGNWFNKYLATGAEWNLVIPAQNSSAAGEPGAKDGAVCIITVDKVVRQLAQVEIKNKLETWDPMYQSMGYYQQQYQNDERWHSDELLRATGAPAFCFELVGPLLCVSVVCTLEGNVMAREPLTPFIPLLPLASRMECHFMMLARVLTAVKGALRILECRVLTMAAARSPTPQPGPVQTPWDLARRVLPGLSPEGYMLLENALKAATLNLEEQKTAADAVIQAAIKGSVSYALAPQSILERRPWTRIPFPLLNSTEFSDVECLPDMASKPVFTCTYGPDGTPVFVKFTQREYPDTVHDAWAEESLTPKRILTRRLPGKWTMVVQERLDKEWMRFDQLPYGQDRVTALHAVEELVGRAHQVRVNGALTAHGDLRPPNVMVRKYSGNWRAQLVDLDWAGVVGQARYPPVMNAEINWHHGAKPGLPLEQEHDRHMLKQEFQ